MSLPLRRSRRVRKPSTYNIGDIIKVTRTSGVTSDGRLLYRLTEGQSPSTNLWLVAFEDDSGTVDEEVYETRFGNLVKRAEQGEEEENKALSAEATKKKKNASMVDGEGADISTGPITSKPPKSGKGKTAAKKAVSKDSKQSLTTKQQEEENKAKTNLPSPSLISDCSSSTSTSIAATQQQQQQPSEPKVSAREQRRLRRQAALDEQVPLVNVAASLTQHRKIQSGGKKRSMAQSQRTSNAKKAKKEKEEVITVQLNTGVLYLYRGLNRRAVFVRKK